MEYEEDKRGIGASAHGDDVTDKPSREDAGWMIRKFKERCEIKTQMIGEAADPDKQLLILNRTVLWSSRGLWIEAEPRHVKEVIKALGLEGASPAPNARSGGQGRDQGRGQRRQHLTLCWCMRRPPCSVRSRRGRTTCPKTCPTVTFATMKLCSKMSRPDAQDLKNMKRVDRFLSLEGHGLGVYLNGKLVQVPCTPLLTRIGLETDSQQHRLVWGMILHGKHLIKAWTKQQSIVATSSAESELYGGNRAATESMGVQAFAKDLGRAVPIRLHVDSSVALSLMSRTGLGKAKHIEIQHLWLQEAVRNNKLTVEKIPSETNSSDLGTRHLTSERSEMLMRLVNCFHLLIQPWLTSS